MITPNRFRIRQRSGWIAFQFEWNRLARQVNMGALIQPQVGIASNAPGSAADDALIGRAVPISKGHWHGDTLVVETSGYKDGLWLDVNGTPTSKHAKLWQRIRKVKTDHWFLEIVYTLDDPTYYTRP